MAHMPTMGKMRIEIMNNIPQVKVGIVVISRDCFPIELSIKRRKTLVEAYKNLFR